jgi:hypothetical protein
MNAEDERISELLARLVDEKDPAKLVELCRDLKCLYEERAERRKPQNRKLG